MEGYEPQLPGGPCFLIQGATSAPAAVQSTITQAGNKSHDFYNADPANDAFIGYGATAALAVAAAVIPVAGVPQNCFPAPAGSLFPKTFPAGTFFAAICAAGTPKVYCTPGVGV